MANVLLIAPGRALRLVTARWESVANFLSVVQVVMEDSIACLTAIVEGRTNVVNMVTRQMFVVQAVSEIIARLIVIVKGRPTAVKVKTFVVQAASERYAILMTIAGTPMKNAT